NTKTPKHQNTKTPKHQNTKTVSGRDKEAVSLWCGNVFSRVTAAVRRCGARPADKFRDRIQEP
ncbi:MAG: hypothetical protein NTY15_16815, partial [Planctomycetota bacterium]|nr:hypothetical protein [Planctomycetota bacterium]